MAKKTKVKPKQTITAGVKERALIARINRKLAKEDQQLRRARGTWDGPRWVPDSNLGEFFTIDVNRNMIVGTFIELEAYGRELGVLAGWEKLDAGE